MIEYKKYLEGLKIDMKLNGWLYSSCFWLENICIELNSSLSSIKKYKKKI